MSRVTISQTDNNPVMIKIDDAEAQDFSSLSVETKARILKGLSVPIDAVLIKEFVQRIGVAQWKLDLEAFCEVAGFMPDDYGQAKFRQFSELNKALSHFDTETLCRILGVGR